MRSPISHKSKSSPIEDGKNLESCVGILGLQGCISWHELHFRKLGRQTLRVRSSSDLERCDRIVIPGGESTTMLSLLHSNQLFEPLKDYCRSHPTWGVCAGTILLAQEVTNPKQESFGLVPVKSERNHYGSQKESFTCQIEIPRHLQHCHSTVHQSSLTYPTR